MKTGVERVEVRAHIEIDVGRTSGKYPGSLRSGPGESAFLRG